jgi:hypothetical protein
MLLSLGRFEMLTLWRIPEAQHDFDHFGLCGGEAMALCITVIQLHNSKQIVPPKC